MTEDALPWFEVVEEAPSLSAAVRSRFAAHPHHVLATLHADGRPRVNGTNVLFNEGRLWIGMMDGARRAVDLRDRPWCALHSAPLSEVLDSGHGDARVEARAVPLTDDDAARLLRLAYPDGDRPTTGAFFELLVRSMSLVEVDGDSLVIRTWTIGTEPVEVRRS